MDTGTEERYLRCRRCHATFEAELPNCPRCGIPYAALVPEAPVEEGSYAEKYQGTEFGEAPVAPPPTVVPRRSYVGILIAAGVALIVIAISVGSLVMLGAMDNPTPSPTAVAVIVSKSTPTPTPTMPPAITKLLQQLADPALNVHISIRSTVSVNAKVTGRSQSATVTMEIDCAGGNESGVSRSGSIATEWRLVDGTYYSRGLPSGKWAARTASPPFIVMSPMFQLDQPRMLQYDGEEEQGGVLAQKVETTDWWTPDTGKLSGLDVARLGISPQHTKLVIWSDSGGTPLYASFRAWTDATDGTNLLNITTTYTFSDAGAIEPIATPKI